MGVLRWLSRFGLDTFLLGLLAAVATAWFVPDLGRSGGVLHVDAFTAYGIGVVFLLYGLTLSPQNLKAGLLNWRLHVLVQTSTFLLFPCLLLGLGAVAGDLVSPDLKLGFFYLAASPSTISSSVAMTSIAGGNVAGAIFNASLSSLIGVAVTPLWIDWYLSLSGQSLPLAQVVGKVLLLVVLPIAVGQGVRPLVWGRLSRHLGVVKLLDRATVLAIVFNSCSDSVAEGLWDGRGVAVLGAVAAVSLGLFFGVFALVGAACRLVGFDRGDTIAAMFCGTKKSLAAGVPMAKIMFGTSPMLGMVIAPIMVYHFLQLVAASIIARAWHARAQ